MSDIKLAFDHSHFRINVANDTETDGMMILKYLWNLSNKGYREVKLYFNPGLSYEDSYNEDIVSDLLGYIGKSSDNGKLVVNMSFYKDLKTVVHLIVDAVIENPLDHEMCSLDTIMIPLDTCIKRSDTGFTDTGRVINHILEKIYALCNMYIVQSPPINSEFVILIDCSDATYNINPLYNMDLANENYVKSFCKDMDKLMATNELIPINKPKYIEIDKVWSYNDFYSKDGVMNTIVRKLTERDKNMEMVIDMVSLSLFLNYDKDPNKLKCTEDNHSILYIKKTVTPYTLNEVYIIGVACGIWGTKLQPKSFLNILEFNTHFNYFICNLCDALYYNKSTEFYLNMTKDEFLDNMRFKIELFYKPVSML